MSTFNYVRPGHPCQLCNRTTDCRTHQNGGVYCRRTPPNDPPAGWRFAKTDRIGFHIFYPIDADESWRDRPRPAAQTQPAATSSTKPATQSQAPRFEPLPGNRSGGLPTHLLAAIAGIVPPPAPAPLAPQARDYFAEATAELRDMLRGEIAELEMELGVPREVFPHLNVRVVDNLPYARNNWGAWLFEEKDGTGKLCGYGTREWRRDLKTGAVRKKAYGRRGCYVPRGFTDSNGCYHPAWHEISPGAPVFLVEGASDTLAMCAMGLPCLGRPGNRDGVDILAQLLIRSGIAFDDNRRIVVVGENDRKASSAAGAGADDWDAGTWPGREGAIETAQQLADRLQRTIYVSMPPPGLKDSREVFHQHYRFGGVRATYIGEDHYVDLDEATQKHLKPHETETETPYGIGRWYCKELVRTMWPIRPSATPAVHAPAEHSQPETHAAPAAHHRHDNDETCSCNDSTDTDSTPSVANKAPQAPQTSQTQATYASAPCPDWMTRAACDSPIEDYGCPTPRGIHMRSDERAANRELFVDCKSLTCPYCGKKKRTQYVDTVTCHFDEREKAAGDAAPDLRVYKFFVSQAEWKPIRTGIVRRGGNYFRIASATDGTYGRDLIVSSLPPSAKQFPPEMVEELTHEQAKAVLFAAIESIPQLSVKAFTTSRGWKLVTDEKPITDRTWYRVSKYSGNVATVEDVLNFHHVPYKCLGGGGRYRQWMAIEWQHWDWQKILFDLDTGEPTPADRDKPNEWRDEWVETLWSGGKQAAGAT